MGEPTAHKGREVLLVEEVPSADSPTEEVKAVALIIFSSGTPEFGPHGIGCGLVKPPEPVARLGYHVGVRDEGEGPEEPYIPKGFTGYLPVPASLLFDDILHVDRGSDRLAVDEGIDQPRRGRDHFFDFSQLDLPLDNDRPGGVFMTQAYQDLLPQAVQAQPVDTPRLRRTKNGFPDRYALFVSARRRREGPRSARRLPGNRNVHQPGRPPGQVTASMACNDRVAGCSVSGAGAFCWAETGEVNKKAVRQASRMNPSISLSVLW